MFEHKKSFSSALYLQMSWYRWNRFGKRFVHSIVRYVSTNSTTILISSIKLILPLLKIHETRYNVASYHKSSFHVLLQKMYNLHQNCFIRKQALKKAMTTSLKALKSSILVNSVDLTYLWLKVMEAMIIEGIEGNWRQLRVMKIKARFEGSL